MTAGVDLVVFAAYLAAVVALGLSLAKRSGTARGFMVAGGALPGWAVGMSMFGTFLSSNTFIGVPGQAFGGNWNAFVFSLSLPVAAFLAARWWIPFYRRGDAISAYHHLEARFGRWARTYAVACYLLTQFARVGSILFGVALAMNALTGWPVAWIILSTGVVVTVYTLVGGIEAVIWTDVIQSVVLTVGALIVVGLLVADAQGGLGGLIETARAAEKFSLGSFAFEFTTSTFWVVLVYGLFINFTNFGIDQSYVQRYHAANSDRAASRSVWLAAGLYLPVSAVFFFIGTGLFVVLQGQPEAAGLAADQAFPHYISTRLPAGAAGLLIAALFAAAMSSIDTSFNSSATVFLSDIYRTWIRPEPDAGRRRGGGSAGAAQGHGRDRSAGHRRRAADDRCREPAGRLVDGVGNLRRRTARAVCARPPGAPGGSGGGASGSARGGAGHRVDDRVSAARGWSRDAAHSAAQLHDHRHRHAHHLQRRSAAGEPAAGRGAAIV